VGLSSWIENYPGFESISGLELSKTFTDHLKSFDMEINSYEEVLSIEKKENSFIIITDEGRYKAKTVIVATGGVPKKLGAKNEGRYLGKGISYCVTCDAKLYEGKIVAVVGGGNAGVEAAIELTKFARKIYLIEMLSKLNADGILIEKIRAHEEVEIITSASVKAFKGRDYLKKVVYIDNENNEEKQLVVDGCFIEIGINPNSGFIEEVVDTNAKNEIEINFKTCETSVRGIYAAGDVTNTPYKQVVIAAGQGAVATLSLSNYLELKLDKNV
jgi:NADH-dependent peroxiredoxin subunit F